MRYRPVVLRRSNLVDIVFSSVAFDNGYSSFDDRFLEMMIMVVMSDDNNDDDD